MAGYLNRFIDLQFPDLAGQDESGRAYVWVKIRNPRLIPAGDLVGTTKVRLGEDGKPVAADMAADETFAAMAKLIIAGNVWDATSLDDDAPLLPMPPTAADVAKMPVPILNRIGEEMGKANPH